MKKLLGLLTVVFLTGAPLNAQFDAREIGLGGGLGLISIGDTVWFDMKLNTELTIGKLGLGLNIPIRVNPKYGIRKGDWESQKIVGQIVKYVRWGQFGDPFHFRVGALYSSTLGHGFIMYNYNNRLREDDDPKVGLELGAIVGPVGFELISSDLTKLGVVGLRGIVLPIPSSIPVLNKFAIGASIVNDFNPGEPDTSLPDVTIWGADAGLPLININFLNAGLYADYAQIKDAGHGFAYGLYLNVPNFFGLLELYANLEQRNLSEHFLPSYFDGMYEIDKAHKFDSLAYIVEPVKGTFGQLAGRVIGEITVSGDYFHQDGVPGSGVLNFYATTGKAIPIITANFQYHKDGIEKLKEVFTVNGRSYFIFEGGYRVYPFLTIYLNMKRTFVYDEATGGYVPQDRYGARLEFSWNFGGK